MKTGWKRILMVLAVVIANIALDQVTKEMARQQLQGLSVKSYLSDTVRIVYVENTGAFLSLGAGLAEGPRYWILTILPVIVLLILFVFTLRSTSLNTWQIIAYSFILGGGISNIYDRILYGGVVDFMNLGLGTLRTGIFNFADVSIMTGLFMILPYLFKKPEAPKPSTE